MNPDAIFALMEAGGFDFTTATKIVAKLEAQGLTIYKKKVSKNGRRPKTSQPLTPALARAIRDYWDMNPEATQQEVANVFNVNIGRVNEVLS
jgi:hypothetical protein